MLTLSAPQSRPGQLGITSNVVTCYLGVPCLGLERGHAESELLMMT